MYYIYEIRCGYGNKVYVGMTSNYKRRIAAHKSALERGEHPCKELQSDYNYTKSLNRYIKFYKIAEHSDKKIAEGLENIFIYRHIAHKEKVYNHVKTTFPYLLVNLDNEFINSFIDNSMILYAYYSGDIGEEVLERVCDKLGKDYLIGIIREKQNTQFVQELLVC